MGSFQKEYLLLHAYDFFAHPFKLSKFIKVTSKLHVLETLPNKLFGIFETRFLEQIFRNKIFGTHEIYSRTSIME